MPLRGIGEPAANPAWARRPLRPAIRREPLRFVRKNKGLQILRHPAGGRRDVFRWTAQGDTPIAELEIYRPGREVSQSGPPIADIAGRMDPDGMRELQAAGVIDSKFGAVTLLGLTDRGGGARPCLGFMKGFDQSNLRSRAGRARTARSRPGAPRSAASWTG